MEYIMDSKGIHKIWLMLRKIYILGIIFLIGLPAIYDLFFGGVDLGFVVLLLGVIAVNILVLFLVLTMWCFAWLKVQDEKEKKSLFKEADDDEY